MYMQRAGLGSNGRATVSGYLEVSFRPVDRLAQAHLQGHRTLDAKVAAHLGVRCFGIGHLWVRIWGVNGDMSDKKEAKGGLLGQSRIWA